MKGQGKRWIVCSVLVVALATLACGHAVRTGPETPRLVLLYAPCTVSKFFLAPYEQTVAFTPNLAHFASDAMVFTSHRAQAGSSGIAYASLFSGSGSNRHGVVQHPAILRDDTYLVAEAFREKGYETYFWNGHGMASMELNYGQGVGTENAIHEGLRADHPRFRALLEGLRADPSRRAFVMTNFTLTHGPYRTETVEAFLARFPNEALPIDEKERLRLTELYTENYLALAYNFEATVRRLGIEPESIPQLAAAVKLAYKANVWRLDEAFGSVLDAVDAVGLHDDSLVVFTADHGEILYREEEIFKWTHSSSLAPEVIEVPLLVRAPELSAGHYEGVTRSIDVFPTILGLSGLPVPGDLGIDGQDLTQSVLGLAPAPDLTAYSHTSVIPDSVYAKMKEPGGSEIWGNRMRLYPRPDIRFSEVELCRRNKVFRLRNVDGIRFEVEAFDRLSDPKETLDVYDENNPLDRQAAAELRTYKGLLMASVSEASQRRFPTRDEAKKQLRALGYIR